MDTRSLRQALGCFATGIAVASAQDQQGQDCGVTINSFSSVSLEPPLILFSLHKESRSFTCFTEATHFAINILEASQQPLSDHFAQASEFEESFDIQHNSNGVPLLNGCLANLECQMEFQYEGGDHIIFVGRILDYTSQTGDPLLYYASQYCALTRND